MRVPITKEWCENMAKLVNKWADSEMPGSWARDPVHPEDSALVSAVVNSHALGMKIAEHHALQLLSMIGVDGDEAEDLLTAAREEASQP